MVCLLLTGLWNASAAEGDGLVPDAVVSNNVTLTKYAERTGPDEWTVTVKAHVDDIVVEPPQLEVVFVLDTSTSMKSCPYEVLHKEGFYHYHDDATCPYGKSCTITGYMYHLANQNCQLNFGNGMEAITNSRYHVAIAAINSLSASLPSTADVSRVVYQ